MLESSLSMREVRGWSMPRISNFSEEPGNQKRKYGKLFRWTKRRHAFVRAIWKGSIWNSTELAGKAIGVPNHQGLPQKDVGGNITILIRESKTSVWHKQLLWTPPARHVNREGQATGMWETHGLMTSIDKANITTICNRGLCSTISKTEERFMRQ